ncbi:histone-lysine N-methyltransferase SETMAR [Trichonephila clavipes]|nr:histone-lysine N-methyltransferase SETMAR [Trichonephila clavipes]
MIYRSSLAVVVLERPPPTYLTAVPVVWNAFQAREMTLLLISNSAATLVTASKKKHRGVIRFLAVVEGVEVHEMHGRMKAEYGEYNLCRSSVVEWRKRFPDGRELMEGSSCHHTENDCSGPHSYHSASTLDVSKSLSAVGSPPTDRRMAGSLSHLQCYHEEEFGFLSQIVTGDETWWVQAWIRRQSTSFFTD